MTHPRVEEVAGYLAESLDPATAGRVRDHLQSCDSCAGTARDLEAVSARLTSAADEPEPIPEHVAARVDAALAAESRLRDGEATAASAGVSAAATGPVSSLDERRRRRRRLVSGGLLAAAAATVVAVGLGEVLPLGSDGDSAGSAGVTSLAEKPAQGGADAQSPDTAGPEAAPRAEGRAPQQGLRGGPEGSGLQAALVNAVVAAHEPGSRSAERSRCLSAALDGAPGDGASYAVRLPPEPGQRTGTPAVVWVHPSGEPQQAVLVACAPEPRVVLRRGLRD